MVFNDVVTVTLTADPCPPSPTTLNAVPSDSFFTTVLSYTLTAAAVSSVIPISAFSEPHGCTKTYSFSVADAAGAPVVSLPIGNPLFPSDDTFLFNYSADLSPLDSDPSLAHKDYQVSVVCSIGTTPLTASETFTFRIINPCHDASLTSISTPANLSTLPWNYSLLDYPPATPTSFTTDAFSVTTPFADDTTCGDLNYNLYYTDMAGSQALVSISALPDPYVPHNDQVAYDSASRSFSIYSEDAAEIGTHALELFAVLAAQTSIVSPTPLSWTIDILAACSITNSLVTSGSSFSMATNEKDGAGNYVSNTYTSSF